MQVDTDLANLERRSMRRPIQRTLHRRCKLGLKADFAALSRTIRDCCAASASSQERRFEGPQEPVMETEASFARVDADDMLVAPGTHWERIEATDENWVATTMKSKEGDDDFAAWPPPPDAGDPPQTHMDHPTFCQVGKHSGDVALRDSHIVQGGGIGPLRPT